jgi:hypothetical protein
MDGKIFNLNQFSQWTFMTDREVIPVKWNNLCRFPRVGGEKNGFHKVKEHKKVFERGVVMTRDEGYSIQTHMRNGSAIVLESIIQFNKDGSYKGASMNYGKKGWKNITQVTVKNFISALFSNFKGWDCYDVDL